MHPSRHVNPQPEINIHTHMNTCIHTSNWIVIWDGALWFWSVIKTIMTVIWDGALWFWSVIKTIMTDWEASIVNTIFKCNWKAPCTGAKTIMTDSNWKNNEQGGSQDIRPPNLPISETQIRWMCRTVVWLGTDHTKSTKWSNWTQWVVCSIMTYKKTFCLVYVPIHIRSHIYT